MAPSRTLLLLLGLAACASCGGVKAKQQPPAESEAAQSAAARSEAPAAAAPEAVTTVRVANRRRVEFDVYVVGRAQRVLLGQVAPLRTRTFTLPPALLTESPRLRFQFEPFGASGLVDGGEMPVRPGDQVDLVINR